MKYSLSNRFRGVLLGSLVGELLATGNLCDRGFASSLLTVPTSDPSTEPSQRFFEFSQMATNGAESLIRQGTLILDEWQFPSSEMTGTGSEVAIATLPIALFFHEDKTKLRQNLLEATTAWPQASEGALVVAWAMARSLQEQLNPKQIIPQILDELEVRETPLGQQLERVQSCLETGAGLHPLLRQLRREQAGSRTPPHSPAIALAIYCFLSTPEDFHLSAIRAVRGSNCLPLTAALTGALSGAYNSLLGIPTSWRLAASRTESGSQRLQLADRLLAAWSGMYDISATSPSLPLAVAAPHVIQSRR
jgi:hypothetical protein